MGQDVILKKSSSICKWTTQYLIIITLLAFFTGFSVKNKRCTADIQRETVFSLKEALWRLTATTGCHSGWDSKGPILGRDLSSERLGRKCWQRAIQIPHQLLGVSTNGSGQKPTSRQLKSSEMALTLFQMKKQLWQKSAKAGKRIRWLELVS